MEDGVKSDANGNLAVIELPDLIQSIGQSGRSGLLRVMASGHEVHVHFRSGMIVACDNGRVSCLSRGLVWTGLVRPGGYGKLGIPEPQALSDRELGDLLIEMQVVNADGLRDAVDCHIEECFTKMLSWSGVTCDMQSDAELNAWCSYQASLGTSIAPGSLLMEGLRRLDESKRIGHLVPARWDVLIRENKAANELDAGADRVLTAWREGRPAGAVLELSGLPPWQSSHAAAQLIEAGILRAANGTELVVYGDKARKEEHYRTAEGLYRRALELGAGAGRIHIALGELAERRGIEHQAAIDYQRGAEAVQVSNPAEAVIALRNALRLGAERERNLKKLLGIYRRMGETDDALDTLFELAQYYEGEDRIEDAMDMVRQAQELNADDLRCSQVLAALALLNDDQEEAIVQLEQVIRVATDSGHQGDANKAQRQLLLLDAGRARIALDYAKDIASKGKRDEAIEVIRRSLQAADRKSSEDLDIHLREFLAELDPDDRDNRNWLAGTYQQRKDRQGASTQLEKLAESQERDSDHAALIETLQRLLDLGGDQGATHRRLALARTEIGMESAAADSWQRAIAGAWEAGDLETALGWAKEAIRAYPCSFILQEQMAELAMQAGDHKRATYHMSCASRLAACLRDESKWVHALERLRNLRPDSLWARVEMLELAQQTPFQGRDAFLKEMTHYAAKTENIGLALRCARLRIKLTDGPGFEERSEYIELLRRAGHQEEVVAEGQSLYSDLCEAAAYEEAQVVLERLVASDSGNADLVVQLAELHDALGNQQEAIRFLRHGISLLQQEQRTDEAIAQCDQLQTMVPNDPEVGRARELLRLGEAVNWSALHAERARASKARIVGEAGIDSETTNRRAAEQLERRVAASTVLDDPDEEDANASDILE